MKGNPALDPGSEGPERYIPDSFGRGAGRRKSIDGIRLRQESENEHGGRHCGLRACARRLRRELDHAEFSLPNLDLFDSPSTGTVTVHSNPTGAEARASNGSTCRTPCALSMPANEGFTVTYTLDGYLPETVAVKSVPAQKGAIIDMTPPRFEPNPVWAELKPAPVAPPPPPPKKRPRS